MTLPSHAADAHKLHVSVSRWPGVLLIAACAAAVFSIIRSGAVAILLSR